MSKTQAEIKLFGMWSYDDIHIKDPTLEKYINLKKIIIPHSHGRHEHRRFWKSSKISVIERFLNRLLSPGFIENKVKGHKSSYNSGKKNKLIRTLKTSFKLIELNTGDNPIQVLVEAICNVAPREETTKITMGGISYASAVDIAPQRRVDLAMKYIVHAVAAKSHVSQRTIEENLANELILAAKNSQESRAIKRKDEIERIAVSAR